MWLLMLLVGILIVTHNLLSFKSTNNLEPSLQGSISKFRLLWVLIIGVIFLNESLDWLKVIGTLLTILAGIATVYKLKKIKVKKSIGYAFLATIVYGVVIGLYKILFKDFNSVTLTFLIFFIPAILNLIIMPNSLRRILSLAKHQGKLVFTATLFGGLGNLALNHALSISEVSRSLVINEVFLIIVLAGEHFFLKEKKDLTKKLLAVILATLGAIFIRLSN